MSTDPSSSEELELLQGRLRRLAEEKSYLQLTLRMIEQINPAPGVHDMVGNMLHNIVDSIGGTNIRIWYWIEDEINYADFLGARAIVAAVDDDLALQAQAERRFVERSGEAGEALMQGDIVPAAWNWAFPLQVGADLVGVVKLENVHILGASLRNYLPVFFSHAALIMSNEIRNFTRQRAQEALRRTTDELDAYFNGALDLFCIADTDGYFRKLNPAWKTALGYDTTDLEGRHVVDLVHPDDLESTQESLRMLADQVTVANFANRFRHKDGSWRWIEWHSRPRGNLIFAAARDITEKKAADDSLRLAASVFANSQEGIVITDADNNILDVNQAFTEITGFARGEVVGRNPRLLRSGRQDAAFYEAMWRAIVEQGSWRGEIWNRRKSGEVYAEILSIDAVRDETGRFRHYVGAFTDISQIKEHQAELERIAHYDTLTGLPNRRLLADRLNQEVARSRRSGRTLGICYLDLDGFKPVNDQFGHEAGDRLLIEIGKRLQNVSRVGDTVARLGGDEFVLLFCDLAQEQECFNAVERVLATVAEPFEVGGEQVAVSASVGVTLFPRDDVDADALMRHADQAMYQAKSAGKGCFHLFDAEHDRLVKTNRESLERLANALRHGEFVLFYQPKVNMVSSEVIGVEALIRWQHPLRGLLSPIEFLPQLMGTGLEIALGEWVLDQALSQLEAWQADGVDLAVSINIGAHQLLQVEFMTRLGAALARHPAVNPNRLELEILESAAIDDLSNASRTLAGCLALGVRFALDDFGTGYSSLTYFRKLPVGTLKIDQGFVRGMVDDPEDLGIIENVVGLAKAFNRPVIAEGVETVEHGAMLIMLGCELGQGYGIARPMAADTLREWLRQWKGEDIWRTLGRYALPPQDVVLMAALRSHQRWHDDLVAFLDNPGSARLPVQQPIQCPFGRWYYGSGVSRYGRYAEFTALESVHLVTHVIADRLIQRARAGEGEEAKAQLPELQRAQEALTAALDRLIARVTASREESTPPRIE